MVMALLMLGVGWLTFRSTTAPQRVLLKPAPATPLPPSSSAVAATPTPLASRIAVHVAGAVKHPGVYYLPLGARNVDALHAAGGPTSQANTDAVDLAAYAQDGAQLYIPTRAEHPTGGAPLPSENPLGVSGMLKEQGSPSHLQHSSHSRSARGTRKLHSPSEGRINLNTATADELEKVPGIGPALAARILTFREQNGPFHQLEDLLQVSGIGPKKFAKMQPFLRLH